MTPPVYPRHKVVRVINQVGQAFLPDPR